MSCSFPWRKKKNWDFFLYKAIMNCFIRYCCKKRKRGIFTSHEIALSLQFIIPAKHILISVRTEQDSKYLLRLPTHLHASVSKCLTDHSRGSDWETSMYFPFFPLLPYVVYPLFSSHNFYIFLYSRLINPWVPPFLLDWGGSFLKEAAWNTVSFKAAHSNIRTQTESIIPQ